MPQRDQIRETLSRDKYISDGLTKELPQDKLIILEAQIHELLTQARFAIAGNAGDETLVTLLEDYSALILSEISSLRSEILNVKASDNR